MACGVTLKRALDLDGLHSPDHGIKRRRTSNLCHHSPYHPAASGFASQQQQQQQHSSNSSNVAAHSGDRTSSVFDAVSVNTKVSSDELYAFLRKELHVLRKRKTPNCGLMMSSPGSGYVRGPDSPSSNSSSDSDNEQPPHQHPNMMDDHQQQFQGATMEYNNNAAAAVFHTTASSLNNFNNDTPHASTVALRDKQLFSFTQVRNICERLLKEQETRLTNEYDKLLNTKLAEQHEAFVRFTYDQIHRRLEDSPMSYLS